MLVFGKRENWSTQRKTSRSKVENQQTQPTYDAGTHWWKASALTTAPSLLPVNVVSGYANLFGQKRVFHSQLQKRERTGISFLY